MSPRFIPSIPGFAYAQKDQDLYVNLFVSGTADLNAGDTTVTLTRRTQYPWKGEVQIGVEPEKDARFSILIRIPGWSRNEVVPSDLYRYAHKMPDEVSLTVNGQPADFEIQKGYARIQRNWKKGDSIRLELPMPVRRVLSHENVAANKGKVALERGPIVYCLEGLDNDGQVMNLFINDDSQLETHFRDDLLGGIVTIRGEAQTAKRKLNGDIVVHEPKSFTAIPYYAWAHRGGTPMTVWPARVPQAARPQPADTLTYTSKTTASFVHVSLDAIKDQIVPADSADASNLNLDFWPHQGTTEWVQFAWDEPHQLSKIKVYWFDDSGRGACRLPKSWRILYQDPNGQFQPARNRDPYGTEKDTFNVVHFDPVDTSVIKIEIVLQDQWAAGIQEVVID